MNPHRNPRARGFTLVELLVVIVIVAILATISFIGSRRFIENGKKVQVLAQMRDFKTGMVAFEVDYIRPPMPANKRDAGVDTIFGDPGGLYTTQFLVSALAGEDKDYPYGGNVTFSSKETNPQQQSYITFPLAPNKKGGVGPDGKLYDPWGAELMVAINAFAAPGQTLIASANGNKGLNDELLWTYALGEYKDTKPRKEPYVFWSYGSDKKKGKGGESAGAIIPYAGSDDVISWQ